MCSNILENRCSVVKVRVHGIVGWEKIVVGIFKAEGGGCHVTINSCSDKKIIRLGSWCCYFLVLLDSFFGVFVIVSQLF